MKNRGKRGNSILEFSLLAPFLCTLLIGLWVYGTKLIANLQLVQVARDTASMYARGTDFSIAANQGLVVRLGEELGMQVTGGNGTVILSTVQFIGQKQCDQFPTKTCANKGNWAFTNRVVFGNSGVRASDLGSTACALGTDGSLTLLDTVTNVCAAVPTTAILGGATGLGTPQDTVDGFKPGQPAYVVEVAANIGWVSNLPMTSGVGYAFAIF